MSDDFPTYDDSLEKARAWRKGNAVEDLESARAVLETARKDYPYALPLVDELALVLQRLGLDSEAGVLLRSQDECVETPGEETLSRLGKLFRRLAEGQLAKGQVGPALPNLTASEDHYRQAFEISSGFYPRINQLTGRLVRAGVVYDLDEAAALLQSVRDDARAMLRNPAVWIARKPDDDVWMSATHAEANVLVGDWPAAALDYAEALRQAAGEKFYAVCMRDQLVNYVLPAFETLGVSVEGPLADPNRFFTPDQEATP